MKEDLAIYCELDTILDTRMGLISGIFPSMAEQLSCDPRYFMRKDDRFDKIIPSFNQADYDDTYAQRTTAHIWGRSYMTGIVPNIGAMIRTHQALIGVDGVESYISVTVNIFPYVLTPKQNEYLISVLQTKFILKNIKVVSLHPSMVTVPYIQQNFNRVFVYDGDEWLTNNLEGLTKTPLPSVMLIHPFIMKVDKGLDYSVVVEEVQQGFEGVLHLQPLPLDLFSFRAE